MAQPPSLLPSETLQQLLEASKDRVSRDSIVLPSLRSLVHTAKHLLSIVKTASENSTTPCDDLIQALRVLRNACTAGYPAATSLLVLDTPALLEDTVQSLGTGAASLNWALPAVTAQAIANFANAGGTATATAIWHRLFPTHFTTLAHIDSVPTQEATCLALLTCCRAVEGACEGLVGAEGSAPLTALLHVNARLLKREECNHTLPLLLGYRVFTMDLLKPLLNSLSTDVVCDNDDDTTNNHREGGDLRMTASHSLLLQELAIEAQTAPACETNAMEEESEQSSECSRQGHSMQCLVNLLRQQQQHTVQSSDQIIQDCLHVLRDICARDDDGRGLCIGGTTTTTKGYSLVTEALDAGLVPTLLAMLKAIGPIQNPRNPTTTTTTSTSMLVVELAPLLSAQACLYPSHQPYQGYRSDVLAVLANASHKRPRVQQEVSDVDGGIELIMGQCQVDGQSPLAREWALWAVRNVCEGSDRAVEAIKELKACTALDSDELRRAGVKVTVDEATGKLKVSKRDDQQ